MVEAETKQGLTPLHVAAADGNTECVKALLDSGAIVGAADMSGKTPLHWAAAQGHAKCVKALRDCGANLDAKEGQ
eukprot:gene9102-biopygen8988